MWVIEVRASSNKMWTPWWGAYDNLHLAFKTREEARKFRPKMTIGYQTRIKRYSPTIKTRSK
jgi:hypothetical protein